MIANDTLNEIIRQNTVKIRDMKGNIFTGFLISETIVATSASNLTNEGDILYRLGTMQGFEKANGILFAVDTDLAFLECKHVPTLIGVESRKFEPTEGLATQVYSRSHSNGKREDYKFRGYTYDINAYEFAMEGDCSKSFSGAPLFCKNTGRIFGFISSCSGSQGTEVIGIASEQVILEAKFLGVDIRI